MEYKSGGAIGKIQTRSLAPLLDLFDKELGVGMDADVLRKIIEQSYLSEVIFQMQTRTFINHLFGHYGLIILDANNRELKKTFFQIYKKRSY